jgi:hypothetical protein
VGLAAAPTDVRAAYDRNANAYLVKSLDLDEFYNHLGAEGDVVLGAAGLLGQVGARPPPPAGHDHTPPRAGDGMPPGRGPTDSAGINILSRVDCRVMTVPIRLP